MKQLKTIKFPGLDDTYFVPEYDLTNYATQEYVDGQIGAIEHPTVDLTGYATEEYVNNAIAGVSGGGGSVNIDGQTIIEENGVIKTAIGGYRGEAKDREDLYTFSSTSGLSLSNNGTYDYVYSTKYINMDTLASKENLHYEIVCFQNGEMKSELASETGIADWGWCNITEHDGNQVVYLGNFSILGDGYGEDVYLQAYSDGGWRIYSTNMPDDFVLYTFNIYVPGVPPINYINNDFIDAGHWATREELDNRTGEIHDYINNMIGGIENGSY